MDEINKQLDALQTAISSKDFTKAASLLEGDLRYIPEVGVIHRQLIEMGVLEDAQNSNTNITWEDVKKQTPLRLYIGDITDDMRKGWIGLSIEKGDHLHIVQDITRPLPLNDNFVDAFQAEDVFEHIPYGQLPEVINELYRVLKPGGYFRLSIPDYGCDVLQNRSVKDEFGRLVFDEGGGGTIENPGHVWFPRIDSVVNLVEKTKFHTAGKVNYLHYYRMDGQPVLNTIDHSKGIVKRTPDYDQRVTKPRRPMSIVVDMIK